MQQSGSRTLRIIAATTGVAAFAVVAASDVTAQVLPWEDNGYVSINYLYHAKDRSFEESLSQTIYEETATFTASHASSGGGGIDVGGGVRVWGNLAAGVAVTQFSSSSALAVAGSVPNPLFFNRLRSVSTARTDLEYKETAVHLQAVWVMPITDKIIVKLGGGPSFFNIDQGLLGAVSLGQEIAPFATVAITAGSATASESAVGGNAGVDLTYMFTGQLGGGIFARWSGGSVDLPASGGVQSIDVGGVQSGIGLRLSF